MRARILSGAVLIIFLAAVIFFNSSFPLALNIALAIISAMCIYELLKAQDFLKRWFISIPALATAAIVPFVTSQDVTFIVYCVYTAIVFIALLKEHKEVSFHDIAVAYSMVIIIPTAMRTLIQLRALGGRHGMFYVLIAILAAWAADAGAYFAGTFLGKHKLCPEISPKKTVEGAIGGVIFNIGVMLLCGFLFSSLFYQKEIGVNYIVLAIIGLISGFTSILGDLSFSLIKRSCHIKDFGQVIPGHGGILDRFDSVIFTAPTILILTTYFPIV